MSTHARFSPAPLNPIAVVGLFLVNAVPLTIAVVGQLPSAWTTPWLPHWMSPQHIPAESLLPVVTVPTVIFAARMGRRIYYAQLLVAVIVCLAAVLVDSSSLTGVASSGIATVGTLICTMLLIERSRRALSGSAERLRDAGHRDSLTGALNRRGAIANLGTLLDAARTAEGQIGIAAVDLDYFKRINDDSGHAAGDAALCRVAAHAAAAVGEQGLAVRSGGEELLLITVGDVTPAATTLMKLLREDSVPPQVTVSIGTVRATLTPGFGADELWAAADQADTALYRAKLLGRNRIVDGGTYDPARRHRDQAHADVAAEGTLVAPEPVEAGAAEMESVERNNWRTAADRARHRYIGRDLLLLYRVIVLWMMVVGLLATLPQTLAGDVDPLQLAVMLPAGWVFGVCVIAWMKRLQTSWTLSPVFVGGAIFETVVVFSVAEDTRCSALMLVLLTGLLVIGHWPQWFALAPLLLLMGVACVGAALAPGRPVGAVLAIAGVTGIALMAAMAAVAALYREHLRAEDGLHRIASTDPLTGLSNRRALSEVATRWRDGWVVMVDVDAFKSINDRFGHGYGDAVLHALARELGAAARHIDPSARAFRIGGDEFVVAGPGHPAVTVGADDVTVSHVDDTVDDAVADRFVAAVRACIDPEKLPTSVSVGGAIWRAGKGKALPSVSPSVSESASESESVSPSAESSASARMTAESSTSSLVSDMTAVVPTDLWSALAAADQRMFSQKQARSSGHPRSVRRPRH